MEWVMGRDEEGHTTGVVWMLESIDRHARPTHRWMSPRQTGMASSIAMNVSSSTAWMPYELLYAIWPGVSIDGGFNPRKGGGSVPRGYAACTCKHACTRMCPFDQEKKM